MSVMPHHPVIHSTRRSTARESRSRRWAGWLLAAYLIPLAALVLSIRLSGTGLHQLADSVVVWLGQVDSVPEVRFGHVEALANLLVFIPIGVLLAALGGRHSATLSGSAPRWPDWAVWLVAVGFSAAIELTQLFLLTERSATLRDLLFNSAGALTGVALHRVVRVLQDHRKRTS